jgi:LysR family transcriptional regulator, transcriptional activator for bauABCD operon
VIFDRNGDSDLRLLRVFRSVVENKSFSAASEALQLSPPAVSVAMAKLERRTGLRLCNRGRSGFQFTAKGRVLYDMAVELLTAIDRFGPDLVASTSGFSGVLSIAVGESVLSIQAAKLEKSLVDFTAKAPNVHIDIRTSKIAQVERLVSVGEVDVGIAAVPQKKSGFNYELLFTASDVLYCGKAHPLFARRDSDLSLRDIETCRMIGVSVHEDEIRKTIPAAKLAATAEDFDARYFLIKTGLYVGYLPTCYVDSMALEHELRALFPTALGLFTKVFVITRAGRAARELTRLFLSCLPRESDAATR